MNGLLNGKQSENAILQQVYLQNRSVVLDFVKKNSGSLEEAKDVFQETMMAFYENVKQQKFKGESAISSYVYSIARFIWLNKLKRKDTGQRIISEQKVEETEPGFLPILLKKEKEQQVLQLFNQLGSDCRKVLVLNIYQQCSMKEVAEAMQYENEQIARNKKYKCLKKLKGMIADKPDLVKALIY